MTRALSWPFSTGEADCQWVGVYLDSMSTYESLLPIATQQHGLVSRRQLRALGISRDAVFHWTKTHRLNRLTPRAYRVAGSPLSEPQRVLAAVLDAEPHSALSHMSAPAWWGLPGFELDPLHVIRSHGGLGERRYLAETHRSRTLLPDHVMRVRGVPVTTMARSLFDIAPIVSPDRLDLAIERSLGLRLTKISELLTVEKDVSVQGFEGVALMRELIAKRGLGYRPTESGLEFRVLKLMQRARLPEFTPQVDLHDDGGWITRTDFYNERLRAVIEVDGDLYHAGYIDRGRDDRITAAAGDGHQRDAH